MTDSALAGGLATVIAYLLGSIPFGYIVARIFGGIDIRREGSGNIGATNVARVLGARWGVGVLLLDYLKGFLPVFFLPAIFLSEPCNHIRVACGVATIVGHMFPCWLKLRGGKGVATALGVISVLGSWAALIALGTFIVVFAVSRIVSLSSIVAAVAFGASRMALMWPDVFSADQWSLGLFSLGIPLLVIVRHRSNIARLLKGEEAKFQFGSRKQEATSVEAAEGGAPKGDD